MSIAADVVTALAAARRGVQLYPPAHPAYGEALDALVDAVSAAVGDGPFVLNWHQGRLYHESVVLPEDVHGARSIAEAYEARNIESLSFQPGFDHENALGLIEVLTLKPDAEFDVASELSSRSVSAVVASVLEEETDPEREERDRQRQADRALYQRTIAALRRLQQQLHGGGAGDLGDAGDLVAHIMGRMLSDSSAVIGLATIRGTSESQLFHSLNVMIYSLALGNRLGLPEEGLLSLGMSALLHDVGKGAFVHDDPGQAEPMRLMHPKVGADILQRVALEDPAPMLVAYEHHMHVDGSGWPERDGDYVAHPYSRMVAIANRYDGLVSPAEPASALTPDRAIVRILQESGTRLDPFFSRLFANALGVFPIGCLVRLTDNSVGVVTALGEDPLAPHVRLAFDVRGNELADGDHLDLAESDVRIVEVIDPEALRVAVSEKL